STGRHPFLLADATLFRCACANRNDVMVRHERGDCKTANRLSLIPPALGHGNVEDREEQEAEQEAADMRFPRHRPAGGHRTEDLAEADQEVREEPDPGKD